MTQGACTDAKVNIREYWHRRSDTYDKLPAPRPQEERVAYKRILEGVLKGDKLSILDVGTGTGFLALLLAEMGHDVTGLDLTEGMLEKARDKATESGLSIRFELGDAEELPFEDELFDAVVCNYLLWTLPRPSEALREWIRVTRRGGRIVVIDGKWQDSSIIGRLRGLSRQLGILIYARSNPRRFGYRKGINEILPFPGGVTPEKATDLFRQLGLGNISVRTLDEVREIRRRDMPLLYRLAYSYPTFLIKGDRLEGQACDRRSISMNGGIFNAKQKGYAPLDDPALGAAHGACAWLYYERRDTDTDSDCGHGPGWPKGISNRARGEGSVGIGQRPARIRRLGG
ncbi:MAG: class I SAM-dependent methyltransferase [Chloroflexota bacterium]